MIIAYIGNFIPEHSTENHVKTAWENLGHTVIRVQEGEIDQWERLISRIHDVSLVLWTRTADLADRVGTQVQWRMLSKARKLSIPTVAFHLDRWWGLNRESSVWNEPFFRCEIVITADGGHAENFESVGINHYWLPPAVSKAETELGELRPEFICDVAFVGSWQGGYHPEWQHRQQLVAWLSNIGCKFWPQVGQPGIRGQNLRDLYASASIVVGDSCLVGNATHYWSDRIPETVGRGGFLIHPNVMGLEQHFHVPNHLRTWELGNFQQLGNVIEDALNNPTTRNSTRAAGRAHVIANHTYDVRVREILDIVKDNA